MTTTSVEARISLWNGAMRHAEGRNRNYYYRNSNQKGPITTVIDTDLELEVQKLFDHKAQHGEIPVYKASRLIDKLKACEKKGKVA